MSDAAFSSDAASSDAAVSSLSQRLLAGRYGELRHLRALAVVEKRQSTIELFLRQRSGEAPSTSHQQDGQGNAQSSEVLNDLENLGSNGRARSLLSNDFRQRLEAALHGQASARLSQRTNASVPSTPHPTPRAPQQDQPSDQANAESPPLAPRTRTQARPNREVELGSLEELGYVRRALGPDSSIRRALEAFFRARTREPEAARSRQSHVAGQPRGQGRNPPMRTPAVPSDGPASLESLQLMAGASFEMLLSMQRMLQQDLGAALAQREQRLESSDSESETASSRSVVSSREAPPTGAGDLGSCVICQAASVNTVFYRCGHLATCARCAHALRRRRQNCPICRAPVRDVIQVFLACAPREED